MRNRTRRKEPDVKRAVFVIPLLLALLAAALPAFAGLDGPRVPTPTALDLKPYAGRVVYVDFWASWCQPCRSSFPWLNELQKKYGERGLTVLMVNEDHDRKAAEAFLAELGGDLQIVWDVENKFAREDVDKGDDAVRHDMTPAAQTGPDGMPKDPKVDKPLLAQKIMEILEKQEQSFALRHGQWSRP